MNSQGVLTSPQACEGLGDSGGYLLCLHLSKQIETVGGGAPRQMPSRVVLGQNVDGGVLQGVMAADSGNEGYFQYIHRVLLPLDIRYWILDIGYWFLTLEYPISNL
jgi:hypothetical protein